jgi:hypothetical protein
MRVFKGTLLACAMVVTASAQQAADPPLADARLTVHTLLREDIFSGFLDNNMTRFERAEKNLASLLESRPDQRANLIAWRGGAKMHRAVIAHEAGNAAEFEKIYASATQDFADAAKLPRGGENDGVAAITGGSYAVFADRLPEKHRTAAWQQAYDNYSQLWKAQGPQLEKFPVHLKGEVLAGMAQSAQRTGRAEESAQFLDRMLTMLAGTPFEQTAKQWKDDPASASKTNLTCKNCHAPGRLQARLKALSAGGQ